MGRKKKTLFQKYLGGDLKFKTYQKVGILLLIIVFSGFLGWLWEFSLAEVEGGFRHIYIKGGNFLPWLNIYAYGAVATVLVTYKIRKYPWVVFAVSALLNGTIELIGGWLVFTLYHGARYWNYSHVWWGMGNIDGFVCPLSAIVFGLGGLFTIYVLLPFCVHLAVCMSKRAFLALVITLFVLVIADDITNLTLKNLGLPTAMNFYEWLGFKYR